MGGLGSDGPKWGTEFLVKTWCYKEGGSEQRGCRKNGGDEKRTNGQEMPGGRVGSVVSS